MEVNYLNILIIINHKSRFTAIKNRSFWGWCAQKLPQRREISATDFGHDFGADEAMAIAASRESNRTRRIILACSHAPSLLAPISALR
jgi:hypothetical protein